jgi:hypothetical protein
MSPLILSGRCPTNLSNKSFAYQSKAIKGHIEALRKDQSQNMKREFLSIEEQSKIYQGLLSILGL